MTHPPHPLQDVRLPGPTLVLVDDSDGLALDALRGIEDVPGIEPTVVPLSTLGGPRKGWGSVLVVAADDGVLGERPGWRRGHCHSAVICRPASRRQRPSSPQREYEETWHKAAGLLRALAD